MKPFVLIWIFCCFYLLLNISLIKCAPKHQPAHTRQDEKDLKKYECRYERCNKVYNSASGLRYHEMIHTGEKPFTCTYEGCNKAFARKSTLRKHQRTHTGKDSANMCFHVEPISEELPLKNDVPEVAGGSLVSNEQYQLEVKPLDTNNQKIKKIADACLADIGKRENNNPFKVHHIQSAVLYSSNSGSICNREIRFELSVINQINNKMAPRSCCLKYLVIECEAYKLNTYNYHFRN